VADQGVSAIEYLVPAGRAERIRRLAGWFVARLFSTSTFLLAARLVGAAAGFFVQLLLARNLSADGLGVYFTATSLIVIGGLFAAHGYPSIATRFVSRYRKLAAAPLLRAFVRRAQLESIALALAIAALVAAAALVWPALGGEARGAFLIAAGLIPCTAAFRLYGSLATATRAFKLAYLPDVSLKPVVLLAALAIILGVAGGITLFETMLALAGATMVLSLAQFLLLARGFPVTLSLRRQADDMRPSAFRRAAARWRREAHAVLLVAIFAQFLPDLAVLIATPFLPTADIGAFGLCLKLAFLIGFFVALTQNLATPDLADALGKGGRRHSVAKLAASASAATVMTLVATIVCIFWGEHILRLFGPDFVAARRALVLLVTAQLVRAVFGPINTVLTLTGERRINLLTTAGALAFLGAATALLGSQFGVDGAALALLLTVLLWSATGAWLLHRKTGVRVDLFAAFAANVETRRDAS
jgi:O-antigen/teichoic acid export membrane protein